MWIMIKHLDIRLVLDHWESFHSHFKGTVHIQWHFSTASMYSRLIFICSPFIPYLNMKIHFFFLDWGKVVLNKWSQLFLTSTACVFMRIQICFFHHFSCWSPIDLAEGSSVLTLILYYESNTDLMKLLWLMSLQINRQVTTPTHQHIPK